MSNRRTLESSEQPNLSFQEPQMNEDNEGKVLLLRRRKICKTCGGIHGPPRMHCQLKDAAALTDHLRCQPRNAHPEWVAPPDNLHLPWIF